MRISGMLLAGLCLAGSVGVSAQASTATGQFTGTDLVGACTDELKQSAGLEKGKSAPDVALNNLGMGMCVGMVYMAASHQKNLGVIYSRVTDQFTQLETPKAREFVESFGAPACTPRNANLQKDILAVMEYAAHHSDQLHKSANAFVTEALGAAYPCKPESAMSAEERKNLNPMFYKEAPPVPASAVTLPPAKPVATPPAEAEHPAAH